MVDHHTCVNSTNTSTVNHCCSRDASTGEITQRDQQKLGSPYTPACGTKTRSFPEQPRARVQHEEGAGERQTGRGADAQPSQQP